MKTKKETLQGRVMKGCELMMTLGDPCLKSQRNTLINDCDDSTLRSSSVSWQFKHPVSLYHSCKSVDVGPGGALQQQTVLITEGECSKCEQI